MDADDGPQHQTANNDSNQTTGQAFGHEQNGTAYKEANANNADDPANSNRATNSSTNCSPTAGRNLNKTRTVEGNDGKGEKHHSTPIAD